MKILHVSPSYYPAIKFGGPIRSVHELNKSLVSKGVHVEVITTDAGIDKDQKIIINSWQQVENVKVKYFSFIGYEHYNFSLPLFFALFFNVKKYDLVHITAVWNFPVWAASFCCNLFGIPYIISPRGTIYPETIALKSTNLKKLYYQLVAKRCLEKASYIHFTSDDEAESVVKHLKLKTKYQVIANGIDLNAFQKSSEHPITHYFPDLTGKEYLFFIGRIHPKKGLDILYQAFAKVIKVYPDLKLVIAGPDNDGYKAELVALSNHLNISNSIIYTDNIEGDAKKAAFQGASMFLLSSYSENFGMTVIESLAMACPIIISNKVGIAPNIESNHAGKVVQVDENELSEAIIELKHNPSQKELYIKNGLTLVKNQFSIDSVSNSFIELYRKIVK
ncbi:MAG: glycosyltransferase [Bacteroidota bacterium]|nr:glycosyltransferase [Bacteroidota bacterium]